MKLFFTLAILLGLSACAPVSSVPDESLLNTYWRAIEIDGKLVVAVNNRSEPHFVLAAEYRAHGSDGCNRFNGSYDLTQGLRFSRMASTMMACLPPVDAQAREFTNVLSETSSYRINGKLIELSDVKGHVRLRLEATALR